MGHIFISYSHKDKRYVEKLEKKLISEGFDVWVDHHIDYGDDWLRVIEKNLDESDAFIIVMSGNSSASNMVQNEITRARDNGKPIFPVLLEGGHWLAVQRKQYADVRDGSMPSENFYKHLAAVMSREWGELHLPKPLPWWKKLFQRWKQKNSMFILAFLVIFLALTYVFLPTASSRPSFENSFALTDVIVSSDLNVRFDKTVFSSNDTIYISLYLPETLSIKEFETRWYYLADLFGLNKAVLLIKQDNSTSTLSQYVLFKHPPPHLQGNYRVDILKNGSVVSVKYFSVK